MSDILGQALIFTSTLHYPQDLMPEPMRFITIGNFLCAGANLLRAGFGLQQISIQDLTMLPAWSLVFGSLSIRGYYRQLKELA